MLCRKPPRIGTQSSRTLTILIGVPSGGTPSVENGEFYSICMWIYR